MGLKSHSLYYFLPMSILIGILLLAHEVSHGHQLYHDEMVTGMVAHRPAEYPTVFAFDPLEGLPPVGSPTSDFYVAPPRISSDYWPCTQCHDKDSNILTKRVLEDEHTNIHLHHGPNMWCLDCHDFDNRDMLHLTSGELIPFTQAYRLCGQCHGDKLRDWKRGIHGKRTGYWNGSKSWIQCVNCHWPHDPHFKPLKPLPPPVRPEFLNGPPIWYHGPTTTPEPAESPESSGSPASSASAEGSGSPASAAPSASITQEAK